MIDVPRRLVINCDDLGYHPTINEAIIEILAQGPIRSASIMPTAPYFHDALQRLGAAGVDRAGVHLAIAAEYPRLPLTPVSDPRRVASLVDGDGHLLPLATIARGAVPEHVAEEFHNQIERVRAAGLRITHLDGHMFCYEADEGGPRLLEIAETLADTYRVPLRCRSATRCRSIPRTYMFWSQADTVEQRERLYAEFFAAYDDTLSELIIHPGKHLPSLHEFSRSGTRRLADYLYFRSAAFHDIVRRRDIRVIAWDEI